MTDVLNLFIPITKVDVEKRLVYGIATGETKDRSGEICDYETSKPFYEAWSADVSKASEGKSFGNLRAMHGSTAAGKLTAITFNDTEKQVEICAKVVDDAEWAKVTEGVYTGFSQGGKYVKRWKDTDGNQRYTADPYEVSLVDMPCLPTATFQVIKANGVHEDRHFTTIEKDQPVMFTNAQIAAKAVELAKAAGDESAWVAHVEAASAALNAEAAVVAAPVIVAEPAAGAVVAVPAAAAPVDATKAVGATEIDPRAEVDQVWLAKDGKTFKLKADAVAHATALVKAVSPAKPLDDALAALDVALGKTAPVVVEGTVEVMKTAMPDGTLDITDEVTLTAALAAFGLMTKGTFAARRHIHKRASALDLVAVLPDEVGKGAVVVDHTALAKGISLYGVSRLVDLLASLDSAEESFEQDGYWDTLSPVAPPELKTRFGSVLIEFGDIVAETLDLILNAMSAEEAAEAMTRAVAIGDMVKARFADKPADPENAVLAKGADDLAKMAADNADLQKSMGLAITALTEAAGEIKKRDDQITALAADVALIKSMPIPAGAITLQVASKEDDAIATMTKKVESGDVQGAIVDVFKALQRNPMTGVPGVVSMHGTGAKTETIIAPIAETPAA